MHENTLGDDNKPKNPDLLALIHGKYKDLEVKTAPLPVPHRTLIWLNLTAAVGFAGISWANGGWVAPVAFGVFAFMTVLLVWRTRHADQEQQK
jgi:hypothetical protein